MVRIDGVKLRRILNSTGNFAYEAEVTLEGGFIGIASSPSAILPGIREKSISKNTNVDGSIKKIVGDLFDQCTLDMCLEQMIDTIGTDISLSISMAFARAFCKSRTLTLVDYINSLVSIPRTSKYIEPLVPIFSGGVHALWLHGSMQQIMLRVSGLPFDVTIGVIQRIYNDIERFLIDKNIYLGLAASSGFLTKDISPLKELEILTSFINNSPEKRYLSIGIDVAAEHLKQDDRYIYYGDRFAPSQFENIIQLYINEFPITYVEDPFDSIDKLNWISLRENNLNKAEIFSDDYSATQNKYIDTQISDGVIIKMKQVGTLTSTLNMIFESKRLGLKTCVSHRSCETGDTFICDLAVATQSDYIKIGGLRRGDRVEKYNRLLRIYGLSL